MSELRGLFVACSYSLGLFSLSFRIACLSFLLGVLCTFVTSYLWAKLPEIDVMMMTNIDMYMILVA